MVETPGDPPLTALAWMPVAVPGTVAGALRDQGTWTAAGDDEELLDGRDWWFRTAVGRVDGAGPWCLDVEGLATLADVWVGGAHVLHSENMFVPHRISIDRLAEGDEVLIRCAALAPALRRRHSRPRWRSTVNRSQNLRWYRTTMLGRNGGWARWAAPVGPWRAVGLWSMGDGVTVSRVRLRTTCNAVGPGGIVTIDVDLVGPDAPTTGSTVEMTVQLAVGDGSGGTVGGDPVSAEPVAIRVAATVREVGAGKAVTAEVHLPEAQRWWPHTHGGQPRYAVSMELGGATIELGKVGFRTIQADRDGDGFALVVNDQAVFARGACWVGPDYVSMTPPLAALRRSLEHVRAAGLNLLRITGTTVYESDEFWDLCDELGLLVWQDCMLANWEPPEDDGWWTSLERELTAALEPLAARPSLAIVCGSSETQQQAAMFGLGREEWGSEVLDVRMPALVAQLLPGLPWVPSSPSGGDLPFSPDQGVAHYFGVGAYLRAPSDVRSAGVRFAGECLAFSIPPERAIIDRHFDGAAPAGHDPRWKAAIPRDAAASWDFEDVTQHYVSVLFDVDPLAVRYEEPEHALDLGRAAVSELMTTVFTQWRRPSSPCAGGVILSWQDLWLGAGWGLLDSLGNPKAPWWALRRVLAPVAVTVSDDGMAGLRITAHNDTGADISGSLQLTAYDRFGAAVETASAPVDLARRSSLELSAARILGRFRDLNHAYRFGPPSTDVVAVQLTDSHGQRMADVIHLCQGPARAREADVGLSASARRVDGRWVLDVATERLAQYVVPELRHGEVDDRWFHLAPGSTRRLGLELSSDATPAGTIRALNSLTEVPIAVEGD